MPRHAVRLHPPPDADQFPQLPRRAESTSARGLVVLVGPNGAGKTNLIEAISFLAPGRGLRRATLEEVAFSEGDGSWAVSAEVEGALGLATLGTGIEPPAAEDAVVARKCRIDREPVASAAAFADHLRVVWLAPAMDGLFTGPASERRRFLDRLVLAVDAEHMTPRQRARARAALAQPAARGCPPRSALARRHRARNRRACGRGGGAARRNRQPAASRACRAQGRGLGLSRGRDRARRLDGTARCRFIPRSRSRTAIARCCATIARATPPPAARSTARTSPISPCTHAGKDIAAADASTGEQKALLIGLVLAHAGLLAEMTGFAPVLLLDEVVAHLDPSRRAALYMELDRLGAQAWMTGADPAAFADIEAKAQMLEVMPGQVKRRT